MKRIKRLNEFLAADPAIMPGKPETAPPPAPPRPARPIPTKLPGEKEKEKPMAAFQEVMDIFFDELRTIKNTPEGAKIIKKLHKKYAQG